MAYWSSEDPSCEPEEEEWKACDEIAERYYDLLVDFHKAVGTDFGKKSRLALPVLRVFNEGRSSRWANFEDIAKVLKRSPTHVASFLEAESAMDVRFVEGKGLVFPHRMREASIESLLRSYIRTYVACKCGNVPTEMRRIEGLRHFEKLCGKCGQTTSLPEISKGFRAVQKGQRRAARL